MPATLINDVFGRLEWDERQGCWRGEIRWPPGLHTEVAVYHPGDDVPAGLRLACANLAWLQEHDEDALRCVAGAVLDLYNEDWHEGYEPMTEDEFICRLEPARLAFGEDGTLVVTYRDGGLFDGQMLEGEFAPDGTFRGAFFLE